MRTSPFRLRVHTVYARLVSNSNVDVYSLPFSSNQSPSSCSHHCEDHRIDAIPGDGGAAKMVLAAEIAMAGRRKARRVKIQAEAKLVNIRTFFVPAFIWKEGRRSR